VIHWDPFCLQGVLAALKQALPPLGPYGGPGLVPATSPLTAATSLHLEAGTEVLGVPIHPPLYHSPTAR